ncbi:hypothetical protein EUGRSUZ_G01455 [Eucalyptus grandis]|uniref:TF-B3 domain-containing protein n=2 Tax=Eucalyptus grandis TaxID=71139 RepID=A0A059BC43_EUCGR|nr:hypothetical protein EUGRSUZ_G01455 [Eucalyptus grandis]
MGKVVGSKRDYEECRRQRMEENKKRRMEELRLNKLAAALTAASPKSTPVKQSKMRTPRRQPETYSEPVRRSSRTANKPAPNYKEVIEINPSERVRSRSYSRRDLLNRVYASDTIRTYAIERAEQLQSSLDAELPSFIKPMLQSHVTGGFWLSLPYNFCHKHIPHRDDTVTLVDEDGEEFETKYLIDKNGLSGGWRGFSIAHDLVDGDALVFQLIQPLTFKCVPFGRYTSSEPMNQRRRKRKSLKGRTRRKQRTVERRRRKQKTVERRRKPKSGKRRKGKQMSNT